LFDPMRRFTVPVLGAPIDRLDWETAVGRIIAWGEARESRYVCICNVHSVVTASEDPRFARVIAEADMATPDGAPVAWMIRRAGWRDQQRINGPDLMWRYLAVAEERGQGVYFYGGAASTLETLRKRIRSEFPKLNVAGMVSPPYRELTVAEELLDIERINASGAAVVFVSLGCPKQEHWMASHRGLVNAVMVGVGAAFDYHAGTIKRAPHWMRESGLEWLHRLVSEPRRLWRRYLVTNSLFLWAVFRDFFRARL
jgi:N-acetylglucosaminyldiphosphoundecaprenol N-acetyl-beta-D-mannosaminyltransferase